MSRQESFAAGELSPKLYGRMGLELFGHGARQLLNYVVDRQGNANSRPGTRLAWNAKVSDVVLVPFLHASGESYVLEFGNLYVRIYNARTLAPHTELVTPFQTTDLPELQWAQFGSTLLVAHRERPPQEIRLETLATIRPARFEPPGENNTTDPALSAVYPSLGGNPPADPVLVAWQPATLFVVDAQHPPREWLYKVSTIVRHAVTGEVRETLARDITHYVNGDVSTGTVPTAPGSEIPLPTNQLILFDSAPIYIEPGLGTVRTASSNWLAVENLYYRGRGQLFGLVGRAAPNARFADFGDLPDYAFPPLRGEAPFRAGEYPSAVAFFAQRRVFAGTATRPSTWWSSAVDEFENNDKPVVPYAGCPLEATLTGRKRERVVAMLEADHLLVFTDTSVRIIGRAELPFDFDTYASVTRPVSEVGALPLMPLDVDGAVLFARAQGRGVSALRILENGAFSADDVSWHAEHLFRGTTARLVSWCFQRNPWGAVWAVREDGQLLTLTRGAGGMWAWCRQNLGDVVHSVCSVPQSDTTAAKGTCDLVFMAVTRAGVTRIERLTPNVIVDPPRYASDPLYTGNAIGTEQPTYPVDSHVIATITKATGTTVTGLGHLEGREVWASCPGIAPAGPFTVVGGAITTAIEWGPTGATTFKAAIGLARVADLELLDDREARLKQKTVVKVGFEVDNAEGLQLGEDFDHLVPWRQRSVADSYEFPVAGALLAVVNVKGAWRKTGRACIRQDKPLELTVMGVTRELDHGGS